MVHGVANHHVRHREIRRVSQLDRVWDSRAGVVLSVVALLIVTTWSYWPTMADLFSVWQRDDDYSAGQLVPLVGVFLIWRERRALRQCLAVPCWWGGIALLSLAEVARIYGFLSFRSTPERYSLLLVIAGLVLMVTGRQVFRRVLWILLFSLLMVPLPSLLHDLISTPLQRLATTGAVFFLEAFGVSVSQQGNVVVLNGKTPLAVAEACSGLRMLTAFIIVAAFIAYMVKRPRWQKGILLLSSIPVAVVCNMLRIFATALLMLYVGTEFAQKFFHDFAGYVMMPAAVMLLFGEIWLMDRIIVPDPVPSPAAAKTKSAARLRAKSPEPGRTKVAPSSS
jgi:exosortase